MSAGADWIAAERQRQIRDEGWSFAHDDAHPEGALAAAADCYTYLTHALPAPDGVTGLLWPWHPSWFKPAADPRRNLVKAGALYLAEAERYERFRKPDQAQRCRIVAGQLAWSIDNYDAVVRG